jgi:hypothetical protein
MQIKHTIANKMSKRDLEIKERNEASKRHGAEMSKRVGKTKGPNPASEGDRSSKVVSGLSSKDVQARIAWKAALASGKYRPGWAGPKKK